MTKNTIFGVIFCFSALANANLESKIYRGTDNLGKTCSLEIIRVENMELDLWSQQLVVKINYLNEMQILTPVTAEVYGSVNNFGNDYSTSIGQGWMTLYRDDVTDNPLSFYYFDGTGEGFKQRAFNCQFSKNM